VTATSPKNPSVRADADAPSAYTLRDGQHEVALHEGDTLIGRGADCALILDGGLVSRRHAIVRVQGARVVVSDLGSRNGTLVNGEQVRGSTDLKPLDRLLVGDVELQLVERSSIHAQPSESMRQAQTIAFESVQVTTEPAPRRDPNATLDESLEEDTSSAETFELIGGVVEKLFALKKTAEAARLLEGPIVRIWEDARRGRRIDDRVADSAADYAVRLAEATNDDKWVVKALDIFVAQQRTLPLPVIDRLYTLLRRLPENNRRALNSYVENLQSRREALTVAERFALKRLEGLIRIASL
jgi:hypothetical protein